jgi:hypothetical protein
VVPLRLTTSELVSEAVDILRYVAQSSPGFPSTATFQLLDFLKIILFWLPTVC